MRKSEQLKIKRISLAALVTKNVILSLSMFKRDELENVHFTMSVWQNHTKDTSQQKISHTHTCKKMMKPANSCAGALRRVSARRVQEPAFHPRARHSYQCVFLVPQQYGQEEQTNPALLTQIHRLLTMFKLCLFRYLPLKELISISGPLYLRFFGWEVNLAPFGRGTLTIYL